MTIKANYGKMSAANFDRGNTFGATGVATIDLSLAPPHREIDVANCIAARTDRGISNRRAEGSGVIEWKFR